MRKSLILFGKLREKSIRVHDKRGGEQHNTGAQHNVNIQLKIVQNKDQQNNLFKRFWDITGTI